MGLLSRLILRIAGVLLMTGAMLFVPAGTLRYWQAWAFLAVIFAFILPVFVYLYRHDRQLLERRMRGKEKLREQRRVIQWFKPAFLVVLLLPGLDHRLGWSSVPPWLSLLCDGFVMGGLLIILWVVRVNSFASRVIEVAAGQRVISSGPYALVRHPMYSGSVLMFLSMPLALGSYIALPAYALLVPFYVLRLLHEEKFLDKELPGYREYCRQTRYRLVPYVW
jgi:protein-S-isoprenylcysteine O-methyltransferase Ste14